MALSHRVNVPKDNPVLEPEKIESLEQHVESAAYVAVGLTEEESEFLKNFSEERRKAVLRKVYFELRRDRQIDWRLIPFLSVLYLLGYLDRANIANAKIEGMLDDLGMDAVQYNIAVSTFFITYIIFELPSNMVLAHFKRPSWYIGAITCSWGLVMTLTGLVHNFGGLVAARVALGVAEAGFFPGAIFIISQWYLPAETQFRVALFYTSSALSGAFSGLLAFAIAKMDGLAGVAGWRWIFIIEGIASVIAGILCFSFLLDSPVQSGRWLDADEIRYLQLRQTAQHGVTQAIREQEKQRKWNILRSVICDWHLYPLIFIYWANAAPNYGLKFSMPQLIKSMGYTSSAAQLLTIPPYTVGAISALVSGAYADKIKWRMPFVCGPLTVVVVAYSILFTKANNLADNIPLCYFAICLACLGLYPIVPTANSWTIVNLAGPTKKAQGAAYMIAIGNIGGVIGSYMYLDKESPKYPTGYGLSFGFAALGIISALILEWGLWRTNKRRAKVSETEVRSRYNEGELALMGDRSPLFRYNL
ncbi:unnamed protein product [Clonostachys byssicola]|uniref:Major facilitator superfamily (MFS) profile domain-containing protein n=1 Tax=Clonostachys byssicola TaxID=160290 RepID=A0A9N9UAG8_9HYPO|nr:unnamed protein product [Clonostachys byssicola]